jgi:hypothetical protein
MINRLYNPWHISNPGEKEADKQLSLRDGSDEDMYVIYQLRISSRYHSTQMAGECDFVAVTRLGIMVIEVKGGVMGYGRRQDGSTGYYRQIRGSIREAVDNPFLQVDANADSIQRYLASKGHQNVFVGKMVCFPECSFRLQGIGEEELWHSDHELSLPELIIDGLERQREKFRENERRRGAHRYIDWQEPEEDEMRDICNALEPQFNADAYKSIVRLNLGEADRRMREGLAVLSGLNENKRLIVQGPPGSGKSTYAFDIIERLCKSEGRKGLYICWNELLAAGMNARINDPGYEIPDGSISVVLYFDLVKKLAELSNDRSLLPTYNNIKKGELRQQVKGAVSKLGSSGKVEKYDFLIIDEAQDLFDMGIDHVVKALLKGNNPLQNGSYYIFYDDSQDYPGSADISYYVRTRDTFKSYAASYSLVSNLRLNTGNGVNELIMSAVSGTFDAKRDYGEDVAIMEWNRPDEVMTFIRRIVAKERSIGGVEAGKIAVLLSSDLFRAESPVRQLLEADAGYELLTGENYSLASQKIRFTSMLKAKGLEWDVVILVCSDAGDRKKMFQLFIGASRAKAKVGLIVGKGTTA